MKLLRSVQLFLLVVCCRHFTSCSGAYVDKHDDRFLSDVNLEHYYVMEEDALSKADVMLRDDIMGADDEFQKGPEVATLASNLTEFKRLINETKILHRLAGPNLPDFLAHPINVYHLLSRLATRWKAGLNMLMRAEQFKRWQVPAMVRRLQKLNEGLPGVAETSHVISYLAQLQRIYGIRTKDLAMGKVKDMTSLKPLTLDEQMNIAKRLHDTDEMRLALNWLGAIADSLTRLSPAQKEELSFNETEVYHMQASSHYNLKNTQQALEITEKILKIDPSCQVAQQNYKFFKKKADRRSASGFSDSVQVDKMSRYQRLCSRAAPRKLSKRKCRVVRDGLKYYKMESVHSRPEVVLFHDVISDKVASTLREYAQNKQRDQAWSMKDKFRTPSINVELVLSKLTRVHARREMRQLQKHLTNLARIMIRRPASWAGLQVVNVGLEGLHLFRHTNRLQLTPSKAKYKQDNVGAFLVFLNGSMGGGHAVLQKIGVSVSPEKGSVLFYYPSETRANSFCPVIGGSLWVAVQPIYESPRDFCEEKDEWD
ncbi:hypothetical protein RRG08_011538 [Elysia crispata]|uniref:Prolyl 4-hydroxylase alpha subunit domain-containing protein n=1 Tax=Elysia crispata TaxID=231223 RepID=A0AAE1E2C9_9GAST|nr:hypothetical protein RRG08_011538 [Elysia crispata]